MIENIALTICFTFGLLGVAFCLGLLATIAIIIIGFKEEGIFLNIKEAHTWLMTHELPRRYRKRKTNNKGGRI